MTEKSSLPGFGKMIADSFGVIKAGFLPMYLAAVLFQLPGALVSIILEGPMTRLTEGMNEYLAIAMPAIAANGPVPANLPVLDFMPVLVITLANLIFWPLICHVCAASARVWHGGGQDADKPKTGAYLGGAVNGAAKLVLTSLFYWSLLISCLTLAMSGAVAGPLLAIPLLVVLLLAVVGVQLVPVCASIGGVWGLSSLMMSSIMIRGIWLRSALYFGLAGIISLGINYIAISISAYITNGIVYQIAVALIYAFAFIARYVMLSVYYLEVMELRKNEAQKAGRI